MSNVDNTQNIISFCTGYSGLELGIKRAGVDVRTICYLEIEVYVQAVLVKAIQEGRLCPAPIWTNVKSFDARPFRGVVDGITGGFPCQPFSSAGKRKGQEDPRHLWPSIANSIRLCRPGWVFLENVPGLVTLGLRDVLQDLGQMGYRTTWGIFSAEEVGAPHQRKRVFILARLGNSPSLRPRGGSEDCEGEQSEVLGERLESDEELADSERCGSAESMQLDTDLSAKPSGCDREEGQELGNTTKHGRGSHQSSEEAERVERQGEEGRLSELEGGCSELGNAKHDGLHEDSVSGGSGEDSERSEKGKKASEQSQGASGQEDLRHLQDTQWPARPGEEQYEWEEPRVTEAQSKLGRATHGTQHRVDRLRLLGNGVVPQTAELAWKTLWKEMNK